MPKTPIEKFRLMRERDKKRGITSMNTRIPVNAVATLDRLMATGDFKNRGDVIVMLINSYETTQME